MKRLKREMLTDLRSLLDPIRELHDAIRSEVVRTCESEALAAMAAIAKEEQGDTIYAVDRVSEELILLGRSLPWLPS